MLAGWCRYGESCKFNHDFASDRAQQYFLQEIKRLQDYDKQQRIKNIKIIKHNQNNNGSSSENDIDMTSSSSSSSSSSTINTTTADDDENFSDTAQLGVAIRESILQKAVDLGYCSSIKRAEAGLRAAEQEISKDIDCGICLEKILSKRGRRFGLLNNCVHAFCLECIRDWRASTDFSTDTVRGCPLCRTTSYYVIASDRYIADPTGKAALIDEVQASKQSIPCKHWNYGRGECPFGDSCFYAHYNPDGTLYQGSTNHSFRMDADGNIKGGKQIYQLNQYLDTDDNHHHSSSSNNNNNHRSRQYPKTV